MTLLSSSVIMGSDKALSLFNTYKNRVEDAGGTVQNEANTLQYFEFLKDYQDILLWGVSTFGGVTLDGSTNTEKIYDMSVANRDTDQTDSAKRCTSSFDFDGTNDSTNNSNGSGTTPVSKISLFVQLGVWGGTNGDVQRIFADASGSSTNNFKAALSIYSDGNYRIKLQPPTTDIATGVAAASNDRILWLHDSDAGTYELWINEVMEGSGSFTPDSTSYLGRYRIGSLNDQQYFDGVIKSAFYFKDSLEDVVTETFDGLTI